MPEFQETIKTHLYRIRVDIAELERELSSASFHMRTLDNKIEKLKESLSYMEQGLDK